MSTWPPYHLTTPEGDEISANISVLWFKPEVAYVGGDLNLFGIRTTIGKEVCEFNNSCMGRIVPSIASIERIRNAGYLIIPCTAKSVAPQVSQFSSDLISSFMAFYNDTTKSIQDDILHGLGSMDGTNDRRLQLGDDDDNEGNCLADPFYCALLAGRIGHASSTIGDCYGVLQMHKKTTSVEAENFHQLLTLGMAKFGSGCQMRRLIDSCAELLAANTDSGCTGASSTGAVVVRSDSPKSSSVRKRSEARTTEEEAPVVPKRRCSEDRMLNLLASAEHRSRILALAGLKPITFSGKTCSISLQSPLESMHALLAVWDVLRYTNVPTDDELDILLEGIETACQSPAEANVRRSKRIDVFFSTVYCCQRMFPIVTATEVFVLSSSKDRATNYLDKCIVSKDGTSSHTDDDSMLTDLISPSNPNNKRIVLWIVDDTPSAFNLFGYST